MDSGNREYIIWGLTGHTLPEVSIPKGRDAKAIWTEVCKQIHNNRDILPIINRINDFRKSGKGIKVDDEFIVTPIRVDHFFPVIIKR